MFSESKLPGKTATVHASQSVCSRQYFKINKSLLVGCHCVKKPEVGGAQHLPLRCDINTIFVQGPFSESHCVFWYTGAKIYHLKIGRSGVSQIRCELLFESCVRPVRVEVTACPKVGAVVPEWFAISAEGAPHLVQHR